MELRELVTALRTYDVLTARQWVADAVRSGLVWEAIPDPMDLDAVGRAIAAGIVELLAERTGQRPPAWTARVPPSPEPILLVRAAATMPRLRRACEENGPEPLRRRGILAPPEFLTAA
jgi:hypothetical protein